jgi:oligoribonuclease NrnB/cAMP/cGMP phosphodiesterase (DHH superfamily)
MLTYLDNSMSAICPSYKCLYIDHHDNAFNDLIKTKTNYVCVINEDYSATKLYADKLSSIDDERIIKYKDLINAVDGWDMWDFSRSPFSLDLQRAFYYHVFSRNTYETFHERLYSFIKLLEKDPPTNDYKPNWYDKLLSLYHTVYQYTIDKAMEHVYNVDNIYCLEFFNELKYIPAFEITLRLQQMNPNIRYFVYAFDSKNDHIKISLRTNNSNNNALDLSSIAETYGGGGHKEAASFVILKSDFRLTLEKIIKELESTNV